MNPSDSKKLKKIEGRVGRLRVEYTKLGDYGFKLISYDPIRLSDDLSWLTSKVKEQGREIERLLSYVDGNDKDAEIGNLEVDNRRLQERVRDLEAHSYELSKNNALLRTELALQHKKGE